MLILTCLLSVVTFALLGLSMVNTCTQLGSLFAMLQSQQAQLRALRELVQDVQDQQDRDSGRTPLYRMFPKIQDTYMGGE